MAGKNNKKLTLARSPTTYRLVDLTLVSLQLEIELGDAVVESVPSRGVLFDLIGQLF